MQECTNSLGMGWQCSSTFCTCHYAAALLFCYYLCWEMALPLRSLMLHQQSTQEDQWGVIKCVFVGGGGGS